MIDNRISSSSSRAQKVLRFFLVRLVLAALFLAAALALHLGQKALLTYLGLADLLIVKIYRPLAGIALIYFSYYLFVRFIEKRPLTELSLPGWTKELGQGAALGFLLITVQVVFLAAFGVYNATFAGISMGLLKIVAISLIAGVFEELIMRGILFRILEEGLGSWLAIAISSLIFGLLHITNPGASVLSGLTIALEAGLLLALAYMYTRRLWLVIGLHFSWNATLGGIYGLTVSGVEAQGLLRAGLEGPDWVTGGAFGLEAGVTALVATLILSAFLLWRLRRTGAFRPAPWTVRQAAPEAT